jgi:GNAT superfamily N-acetyltransferase
MRSPSSIRGGDEGDLLKQALLLELFELLIASEPEPNLLYVEAGLESHEGLRLADMPALDWFASISDSVGVKQWADFPLWKLQHTALARGEYMSTAAMVGHCLTDWKSRNIRSTLWFSDSDAHRFRRLEEFWRSTIPQGMEWGGEAWPYNICQIAGASAEILRNIAYSGAITGQGVLLCHPPENLDNSMVWAMMIEMMLLRKLWVMVAVPYVVSAGRDATNSGEYRKLWRELQALGYTCMSVRLKGRSLSWHPHAKYELWIIAPSHEKYEQFELQARKCLSRLFGLGLGRTTKQGQIEGLKIEQVRPDKLYRSDAFLTQFPVPVEALPDLTIDLCRESDIDQVISLWNRLMDEHAVFNEHFQRHSMSDHALRQSLSMQMPLRDHLFMVIRGPNGLVGFINANIVNNHLFEISQIGQITDVFIVTEWREKGIGRQLFKLIRTWFELMDIKHINLNIALFNERGLYFWEKMGFMPYLLVSSHTITE